MTVRALHTVGGLRRIAIPTPRLPFARSSPRAWKSPSSARSFIAGSTKSHRPLFTSYRSLKQYEYPVRSITRTMASEAGAENTSGVTEDTIREKLQEQLNASYVQVDDISGGCGQSFSAIIVSDKFEGKRTLGRHRLVNGALKEEIAAIHAWTPKCFTPEEWEKQKSS